VCGICGFLYLDGQPVNVPVGRRMTDLLWHCGPGSGEHLVGKPVTVGGLPSVFLDHRRLKIVDLSEAVQQPLANEDETVWAVCYGEIYNFQVLRHDLE
jgi:asparagine synthase (glutamine-hydrolysing)